MSFTGIIGSEDTRFRPTRLDEFDMDPEDYLVAHDARTSLFALNYDVDLRAIERHYHRIVQ